MPNALIEAMSLGLPCISTDCPCGGPKDLIINEENGLLVPVDDKNAMKDAIIKVLSDKAFADKIGQKAALVQEKYDPKVANEKWEKYFERVLEGR